jgi:hypothetical protein
MAVYGRNMLWEGEGDKISCIIDGNIVYKEIWKTRFGWLHDAVPNKRGTLIAEATSFLHVVINYKLPINKPKYCGWLNLHIENRDWSGIAGFIKETSWVDDSFIGRSWWVIFWSKSSPRGSRKYWVTCARICFAARINYAFRKVGVVFSYACNRYINEAEPMSVRLWFVIMSVCPSFVA